MSAPRHTDAAIAEGLRLAFGSSPLAQPPEANYRCRFGREEVPDEQRTCDEETITCSSARCGPSQRSPS